MEYGIDELKQEVRIALDQNMSSAPLLASGDIDTLSLDDIIESKIADAARFVLEASPAKYLDGGKAIGGSIEWEGEQGRGMGVISLPDDYLRLLTFQMSDWSRAVTVPITEDDPLYAQQSSRYPGVRGCPQKPVVAIVNQAEGLALEFYSCNGGEGVTVKKAQYIAIPKIEEGKIEICDKLKSAVVYYTAYLTALSINDAELAKNMLETSNEMLK